MDQIDRTREIEVKYCHRGCGAVISVGAYGDWHLCEACEVLPNRPHRRPRESMCARVKG